MVVVGRELILGSEQPNDDAVFRQTFGQSLTAILPQSRDSRNGPASPASLITLSQVRSLLSAVAVSVNRPHCVAR